MKGLLCLFLLFICVNCDYKVKFEEVSSIFLPAASDQRRWDTDAADSASYDPLNKYLYVVGGLYRSIIDTRNPTNLAAVGSYQSTHGNVKITDVAICGNYFIQTVDNTGVPARGTVEIFKKYEVTVNPEKVFSREVGSGPSSVKFLPDCKTAIVTVNGYAYGRRSDFVDPLGKILIVRLPSDQPTAGGFADNVRISTLNFTFFDNRTDELSESGVRFVYRGNNNNFSNDADPNKIAISKDSSKAYISLQRNNAIAVVDIASSTIEKVVGLGSKNWSNLMLDPSDMDGGIRLGHWSVYSFYLPEGVQFMTLGDKDYILTANEGKEYDYSDLISWTEVKRGREFVEQNMTSDSLCDCMLMCLSNDTMLGRLAFTTENGENNTNGYSNFYMFGSRSYSIWDAETMELVYDSGDEIEQRTSQLYPDLFNNPVNRNNIIKNDADKESAGRGPETESVEVGSIENRLSLIFVGNEAPGTILLFSVLDDVTTPRFEDMWQGVQNTSQTWQQQFNSLGIQGIKPERIIFLPAEESPTQKPALFVIGSGSSSVTLLNVILEGTLPPLNTAPETSLNILLLTAIMLVQFLTRTL